MQVKYDKQADAVYVALSQEPSVSTQQFGPDRLVDFTASGGPKGLEFLNASDGIQLSGLPIDVQGVAAALGDAGLSVAGWLEPSGSLLISAYLSFPSGFARNVISQPEKISGSLMQSLGGTNSGTFDSIEFEH